MTGAELTAAVSAIGAIMLIIGGIIVRDRQVHKGIQEGDSALRKEMKEGLDQVAKSVKDGDDQIHERVNRVRDEYVKRVDHDASMGRIDSTLQEIRSEQRELYRTILQHFPSNRDGP